MQSDLDILRQSLQEENRRIEELEERLKKIPEQPDPLSIELSKRLRQLEIEKETIISVGEREEEHISQMLQSKLRGLMQNIVTVENELEAEQEYLINTITKQMAQTISEKLTLQQKYEAHRRSCSASDHEESAESSVLGTSRTDSSFSSDSEISEDTNEKLRKAELKRLRQQMKIAQRELMKNQSLYTEIEKSIKRRIREGEVPPESDASSDASLSDTSGDFSSIRSRSVATPQQSTRRKRRP